MKVLSAPLSICLGITNKCNLSCKHCLALNSRTQKDLTTKELLNIVSQIIDLKIFNVALFGGEPLLRKDFFAIVEALNKPGIILSLNTNATLITKDIAKILSEFPIKVYTVSLDGSCAKVHDAIRGHGAFEKVIRGIRNLINKKCNVLLSTTVSKYNACDMESITLLGNDLGVSQVRFNDVMYIGNAACYHKSLVMSPREKFNILDIMKDLKMRFNGFVTGSLLQVVDIMQETQDGKHKVDFPLKISACGAGVSKCAIRPDGWVTPCEIVWDAKAGNLRKEALYDIWHHSSLMNAFRNDIELTKDDIPECEACEYLRLCYKGHRCSPYYFPGRRFEHKELYCWREDVVGAR